MTILFVLLLMVIVVVLQGLASERSMSELEVSHRPDKVLLEPGERFHIILTFENRSRFLISFLRFAARIPVEMTAYVEERKCHVDSRGEKFLTGTTWLGPYQTLKRQIPVFLEKRGRYLMREVSVFSGDFLGFQEKSHSYEGYKEMVVYPKGVAIPEIDYVFGGFLGELSVNRFLFEDPVLTLGYREYSGREPMKTISWTQSARAGQLMVKNYDHTMEPTVSVVLNVEQAVGGTEGETLVETCFGIARTVCEKLESKGIKYSFSTNAASVGGFSSGHYFTEGFGRSHFSGIMECLGRAFCAAEFSYDRLLRRTVKQAGAGHGIIFITPGDKPEVERDAKALANQEGGTILILTAKEMVGC